MNRTVESPAFRWAVLAACLAVAAVHALNFWPEVIDDSYIVFRYARNFLRGDGYAFNAGGPPVEGFSSFTWFWLSTLALRLGSVDVLTWIKWAGFTMHLATVAALWQLAGGANPRGRGLMLMAPMLFAIDPFAAYHAVTGLEMPLYVLLMVTAVLALQAIHRRPVVAGISLALSLSLLIATRPEGFGYAGALLVAGIWMHQGAARRNVLWAGLAVALATAALLGWRWTTFGQWLPNTVAAKSSGSSGHETIATGLRYVGHFYRPGPVPVDLLLYAAAAIMLLRRGTRSDLLWLVPVVCATAFSTVVRGDWMHSFRFMVPAVPFIALLVSRAAVTAQDELSTNLRPGLLPNLLRAAAVLLIAAFAAQHVMLQIIRSREDGFGRSWKPLAWPLQISQRMHEGYPVRLAAVTRWTLEHLSPRDMLATADIGFPGWTLDEPILDVAGLTDAELARIVPRRDTLAFAAYLKKQSPFTIVLRLERGTPGAICDALVLRSGILDDYWLADSLESHSRVSRVLLYARSDASLEVERDSILARYDRAIAANPQVGLLREWRAQAAAR